MTKKLTKGLVALKKEAPEVVKSMGYKKGGMMNDYSKKKPYQMNMGGMADYRTKGMFSGGMAAKKK